MSRRLASSCSISTNFSNDPHFSSNTVSRHPRDLIAEIVIVRKFAIFGQSMERRNILQLLEVEEDGETNSNKQQTRNGESENEK